MNRPPAAPHVSEFRRQSRRLARRVFERVVPPAYRYERLDEPLEIFYGPSAREYDSSVQLLVARARGRRFFQS